MLTSGQRIEDLISQPQYAHLTNRQIADYLDISQRSVRRHFQINPRTTRPQKQRTEMTALMMYDIHAPHECNEHIALAMDYAKTHHKINTLVLGGDAADFHGISRWGKDPYGMPFHEEIQYAADQLLSISLQFKSCSKYFIKGNHEARLESYMWTKAPELSRLKGMTVQEQLELGHSGYEWIDQLKRKEETGLFWQLGRLTPLHGHELGICPSINPARQYFMRSYDNVMVGHVHKVDDHYARTIAGKTLGAFVVGPLCDMNPQYRPQNDWVAGFAVVEFDSDGYFKVSNYKIIDGRVL